MKTIPTTKDSKVLAVRIDPTLDKCDNVMLFPEKLAKANEMLKKAWAAEVSRAKKMNVWFDAISLNISDRQA